MISSNKTSTAIKNSASNNSASTTERPFLDDCFTVPSDGHRNNVVASRFADENVEVSMNSATLTANVLNDTFFGDKIFDASFSNYDENTSKNNEITTGDASFNEKTTSSPSSSVLDEEEDNEEKVSASAVANDVLSNVPTPTGKNLGKTLTQEEAKAALAERRRLAREQLEREKELERQREERER